MRAYAIVVALLAGSASAATVPIGTPLPNFNKGEPLAGFGPAHDVKLLSNIVRVPASTPERRFWYSGLASSTSANSTDFIGSLYLEDTKTNPDGFAMEPIEVLNPPPEGAVYGMDAIGGTLSPIIVGTNRKIDTNRFRVAVQIYEKETSGADALRLSGEYLFSDSNSASTEGLALLARDKSLRGLWQMHLAHVKGNADCSDLHVAQFSFPRSHDPASTISLDSDLALSEASGWCHKKYVRGTRWIDPATGEESLVFGARCSAQSGGPAAACVYKVRPARLESGLSLALDLTWGGGDGRVMLETANGSDLRLDDVAFVFDGSVVVAAGIGNATTGYLPYLIKLDKAGLGDKTFGTDGVLPIPATGLSTSIGSLTSGFDGGIQVTGTTYSQTNSHPFAFFYSPPPPSAPPPVHTGYAPKAAQTTYIEYTFNGHENSAFFRHIREPDGTITAVGTWYPNYPNTSGQQPLIARIAGPSLAVEAVQYFHAGFGHYFLTASEDEKTKLDSGFFQGWKRTGESFYLYPPGTAGTNDLHRFFSTGFGEKSSHFFTHIPVEAELVMHNPDWQYEGIVGAVRPLAANGECPADAGPVFRAYNDGMGGAPNHSHTMSTDKQEALLGMGYVAEGFDASGRIFCGER